MDEKQQELKNNENQIIESYDGSPEDVVFFRTPEQLVVDESERRRQEIWGDEPDTAESETIHTGTQGQSGGIDVTDPHYVNYKPDPYYEYGYGSEPQPKRNAEGGKNPSVLSGLSFGMGLASYVLCCGGISYVTAAGAIGTGIAGLMQKDKTTTDKVFSIIGISVGGSLFALRIWMLIWSVMLPLMENVI